MMGSAGCSLVLSIWCFQANLWKEALRLSQLWWSLTWWREMRRVYLQCWLSRKFSFSLFVCLGQSELLYTCECLGSRVTYGAMSPHVPCMNAAL